MKIQNFYSNELKTVLEYVEETLFKDNPTTTINSEYVVVSIIHNRTCLAKQILDLSLSKLLINAIYDAYYEKINSKTLSTQKPNSKPQYSKDLIAIMDGAMVEMEGLKGIKITTEHVLLSILKHNEFSSAVFSKSGITYDKLKSLLITLHGKINIGKNKIAVDLDGLKEELPPVHGTQSYGNIKYGKMVSEIIKDNKIDIIVNREDEMWSVIQVLGRKNKNNVIIVGDGGVGKTYMQYILTDLINKNNVPQFLLNKKVLLFDHTAVISSLQFKGEFETRMTQFVNTLKGAKKYILFIDDLHLLINDKNSDVDYKPFLDILSESPNIQLICTTNHVDYKNFVEKDKSLQRKFQKINLEPTDDTKTKEILTELLPNYEKHHKVMYDVDVIDVCIKLSKKYLSERSLPDSAIDLIDEVGVTTRLDSPIYQELMAFKIKLKELINKECMLVRQDANLRDIDLLQNDIKETKIIIAELEKNKIKEKLNVTTDVLYSLVSRKTKIPMSKLNSNEKSVLLEMNNKIKKSVIGQDAAVDKVCKAIKRNRVGLSNPNKPMAVLLFLGKSGVGKTFLAKKVSEEIFGDDKFLVRLDMSEFSERSSVSKLIGAAPGYIGYNEGGGLTETIKKKKFCVLLLDEIEKSNAEIFNVFLQVFDEGHLTDSSGDKIDFRNTIVIMTSNIGVKEAEERGGGIGLEKDNNSYYDIINKEMKRRFAPEFLNRLDDVVYFNPLTEESLKTVVKLELGNLNKKLSNANNGWSIEYSNDVIDFIINNSEKTKDYGARPIIRTIQEQIESSITDLILEKNIDSEHVFNVRIENNMIINS